MDVLDRLHTRLLRGMEARGGRTDEPFTVAELYQQLIPYRAVRGELSLLELAPYEHALLRLLAGERGYLRLADADVVEDLRRELREPNPILGVYRDYAEVRVWLTTNGGGEEMDEGTDEGTLDAEALDASGPAQDGFVAPPLNPPIPAAPAVPAVLPPPRESSGDAEGATGACISCAEDLPQVEGLRFCPACGVEQKEQGCAGCGGALRSGWEFCVHCGRPRR